MTDIVLEHLKRIQAELSGVRGDVRDVKADVLSLRSMFGDFLKGDARREGDLMSLTMRVERLERRLDLGDRDS